MLQYEHTLQNPTLQAEISLLWLGQGVWYVARAQTHTKVKTGFHDFPSTSSRSGPITFGWYRYHHKKNRTKRYSMYSDTSLEGGIYICYSTYRYTFSINRNNLSNCVCIMHCGAWKSHFIMFIQSEIRLIRVFLFLILVLILGSRDKSSGLHCKCCVCMMSLSLDLALRIALDLRFF